MDIQKSVALVSDLVIGSVLVVGGKNLALGMVDDTTVAIVAGVTGVLMGIALWVALYGTARNRPWTAMVHTPCYVILFLVFSVALAGAVIKHLMRSPAECWLGAALWAVVPVNLAMSVASLRKQRSEKKSPTPVR